jgi:hypothetical protein
MKHERTVNLLMKLRQLHEVRAQERLAASEAAVRAAEAEVIAARDRHLKHMVSSNAHEREVITSLRHKVLSPTALERIQDDLDILKSNGTVLAQHVATAQSTTRVRRKEEHLARVHLHEALEKELTTAHMRAEENLLELQDEERITSGASAPHGAAASTARRAEQDS